MMEQLTEHFEYLYIIGIALSLLVRFTIITVSIFINKYTRLKEFKNVTKKLSIAAIKRSYLSLIWPIEVMIFLFNDIRFLVKK